MNKKYIGIVLIILGAADLLIWLLNDFSFGWLELVVGVNFISKYGAWLMIFFGYWLFNRENAKEKAEVDEILDLEEGEIVVFKNVGNSTIITLTNKKIIYRAFHLEQNFINSHNDLVSDEKALFDYKQIEKVRAVKNKDTGNSKIARAINLEFGIQLLMKNGMIYNLPTSKSELISAHINKYLNN